MALIKQLITNKILVDKSTIKAQQLAACMAWQILTEYPIRQKPKEWTIYKNLRGIMLADEVGGGKTFETLTLISKALLNISKTHKRNRFRVLIIANPSIRSKWEWRNSDGEKICDLRKFIQQTKLNSLDEKDKLEVFFSKNEIIKKKTEWIDKSFSNQGIWLTSFLSLPITSGAGKNSYFKKGKRKKSLFPQNCFDWIIVDEAHALKRGSKDIDESIKLDGSAVRKIFAVINANKDAKIILLTATPFQNNKSELKHLLSILEKSDKKNTKQSITGLISKGIDALDSQLKDIDWSNISLDAIKNLKDGFDNDINKLICTKNREGIKRPRELKIGKAKNGLDDFLRDVMIRNTKETLPVSQAVATLDEKAKLQYLLFRDLIKNTHDDTQMFSTKLSQLVSSKESFSKNNINGILNKNIENLFGVNLIYEAKYKALIETIKNIQFKNNKNVITVFVSWIGTLESLNHNLKKDNYNVKVISGETPTDERTAKLEEIENENKNRNNKFVKPIILLVSRVGNEGLDFDKFSNRVIHYDNNFNPAVIDQRNGRVYRDSNIRSQYGKVSGKDLEIYQLYINETYDQRILFIEHEKRKLKNFYLGDDSLQKVMEKTISQNNLPEEEEILKILNSIKIDLTPEKKYILKKYKKEIA